MVDGRGGGAPNGPGRTAPFSRWFRYPAGFGNESLDLVLAALEPEPGMRILDPFAGVATLGPWAAGRGIHFFGLEANPLVADVADLKCGPWPDLNVLSVAAKDLVADAEGSRPDPGLESEWLQRFFEPTALAQLLRLRSSLSQAPPSLQRWLRLALVATLRDVSSASVGWPYQRPSVERRPRYSCDPFDRFLARIGWMVEDMSGLECVTPGEVHVGDARVSSDYCQGSSLLVDAIITSPPYLNNYDYADATRLELYFLGLASTWRGMCEYARRRMLTATTQQTRMQAATDALDYLQAVCTDELCRQLLSSYEGLTAERSRRSRGKEYNFTFAQYMADMHRALGNMVASMRARGRACMVIGDSAPYGIYIDTPHLVAQLGETVGLSCDKVVSVRRRGSRWTSNGQRTATHLSESVVVLSRP